MDPHRSFLLVFLLFAISNVQAVEVKWQPETQKENRATNKTFTVSHNVGFLITGYEDLKTVTLYTSSVSCIKCTGVGLLATFSVNPLSLTEVASVPITFTNSSIPDSFSLPFNLTGLSSRLTFAVFIGFNDPFYDTMELFAGNSTLQSGVKLVFLNVEPSVTPAFKIYRQHEFTEKEYQESFLGWMREYNRSYTSTDFAHRYLIFKDNLDYINSFNAQKNHSVVLGVNEFIDLTIAEYVALRLIKSPFTVDSKGNVINLLNNTLNTIVDTAGDILNTTLGIVGGLLGPRQSRPNSIDWRTWGMVNKVKNQGSCGSCYAFSANGALESHYFRKYNRMLDLSEQQIVDCTGRYGNGGCSGGWMHNAYKYITDNGGINQQHNYPYEAKVGQCRYKSSDAQARISKHVMIPQHNEEELANAVASVGPVAVAYDASTREFMLYKSGIYDSPNCDKYRTTHAVVVVGYGTENGIPYWTLKNSWGEQWGENGYFRMRRNTGDKCGIATFSSYPIVA